MEDVLADVVDGEFIGAQGPGSSVPRSPPEQFVPCPALQRVH